MLTNARDVMQLAFDGMRVMGWQVVQVGEERLARENGDPRMLGQPGWCPRVGHDINVSDPRGEQVDRTQGILQLVELTESRLGAITLADDVALHAAGPDALPLQLSTIHP